MMDTDTQHEWLVGLTLMGYVFNFLEIILTV
jgi:hypothetical protein